MSDDGSVLVPSIHVTKDLPEGRRLKVFVIYLWLHLSVFIEISDLLDFKAKFKPLGKLPCKLIGMPNSVGHFSLRKESEWSSLNTQRGDNVF